MSIVPSFQVIRYHELLLFGLLRCVQAFSVVMCNFLYTICLLFLFLFGGVGEGMDLFSSIQVLKCFVHAHVHHIIHSPSMSQVIVEKKYT